MILFSAHQNKQVLSIGYILTKYKDSDGKSLNSKEEEFLTAAVFGGMLVGGLLSGLVSDRLGRKRCLLTALATNTVAAAASALAPNPGTLIACRVVAGLGVGGSVPAIFTLAAELFPPAHRGAYLTIISSVGLHL
jgi:VNT family MFS transporter (synaptic vesicle glycoprotein 2)